MKKLHLLALVLSLLIISLPICFSQDMNLVYDANGNMVTGDGFYREYNSLNQLWKVRLSNSTGIILENYIYDPVEEKVLLKNVSYANGTWKETVYYRFDEYVEIQNASGWYNFTYVEHEGQRIAEMRGNTTYYVLGDALGSSTVITNASGNLTEQSSYTPFGSQINSTIQSRYSYTGQEFDSVIGDYDYHARRYRADWGKFLQPDSVVKNPYNPQELNRYSYVNNNPWNRKDPTGHSGEPLTITIELIASIFGGPELAIGLGLFVVGSLVVSTIMNANEAAIQTKGRGLTNKEYDSKEDWLDNELPRDGEAPFRDPSQKERGGKKYKYDKDGYPVDEDGKSWKPDRTEHHWDRQDNPGHTRITMDGKILASIIFYNFQNVNGQNVVTPTVTYDTSGSNSGTNDYTLDLGDNWNNVCPIQVNGHTVWTTC